MFVLLIYLFVTNRSMRLALLEILHVLPEHRYMITLRCRLMILELSKIRFSIPVNHPNIDNFNRHEMGDRPYCLNRDLFCTDWIKNVKSEKG